MALMYYQRDPFECVKVCQGQYGLIKENLNIEGRENMAVLLINTQEKGE